MTEKAPVPAARAVLFRTEIQIDAEERIRMRRFNIATEEWTERMARYYFNVRDGETLTMDEEGADFPDLESARTEGEEGAREILAEIIKANGTIDSRVMEITDERGSVVAEIAYKEILAAAAAL